MGRADVGVEAAVSGRVRLRNRKILYDSWMDGVGIGKTNAYI